MLKFGDVIQHDGSLYIYLAQKDDGYTYYFAKIISDKEIIRQLIIKKENYRVAQRTQQRENILQLSTCFTILTSEDFEGEVAFLGRPDGHPAEPVDCVIGSINLTDVAEIKKEILDNPHVLPPALINAIKELL